MPSSYSSFFNNLFFIEISLFGIILAAFFVFLQMAYNQYSTNLIKIILFQKMNIVYTIFILVHLFITAIVSFKLSFPSHDFIPCYNFNFVDMLPHQYTLFIIFILFLGIIMWTIYLGHYYSKRLAHSNVCNFIADRFSGKDIKYYILQKNASPSPEKIKDPLELIHSLIKSAINKTDLIAFEELNQLISSFTTKLIKALKEESVILQHDKYIVQNYLKHVVEFLKVHLETSKKHGTIISTIELLEISKQVLDDIFPRNESTEIKVILDFWKDVASESINNSPQIFIFIMKYFEKVIGDLDKDEAETSKETLNILCEHLGFLGTRLLELNKNIADSQDFDELCNVFGSIESYYTSYGKKLYPLSYFNSIVAVYGKLILIFNKNNSDSIKYAIQHFIKYFFSFAEVAIKSENVNVNVLYLAITRLEICYDKSSELALSEISNLISSHLVQIGFLASEKKLLNTSLPPYTQPFQDFILDIIKEKGIEVVKRDFILPTNEQREYISELLDIPRNNSTIRRKTMIQEGKKAPNFTLESTGGDTVSLKDFTGKKVVLYFYPKDNTSDCTKQACAFRDNKADYDAKDAVILGVSRDSIKSHQRFIDKHKLNFTLLSDPDGKVCQQYGAWGKKSSGKEGIIRTTVIIDASGNIEKIYNKVKVAGHVEAVLAGI